MQHGDPKRNAELGHVLVTGGAGFVGTNFVQALLDQGLKVRSFDLQKTDIEHENLEVIEGDIRDQSLVAQAVKNIDCIFHTAAVIELKGGKAVTQKYRDFSYSINVDATKALVLAAQEAGVKRFVYTASNSVVLGGAPIRNGTEDLPYTKRFNDLYTETKVHAEKWVLAQSGQKGMYTCSVRPSGIWGPGDQTMFKEMFQQIVSGLFKARVGMGNAKLDNSFVHNLIHGQMLAALQLEDQGAACGQAYFINDGEPVNVFEFSKPVLEAIRVPWPIMKVSSRLVKACLSFWQFLHFKFGIMEPPIPPLAIERVAVDNYFSIAKAKRDLGYQPLYNSVAAMDMSLPYYQELFMELSAAKKKAA